MASSLALKKLLSAPTLLNKTLRPARGLTQSVSSRLFNTNAARDFDDCEEDDGGSPVYARRGFTPFPGVVVGPLPTRNVSQLLNMMDQFADSPLASGVHQMPWDVKETKDAVYLRVDMPGLGKEDVKVSVENNALIIKGERKEEFEDDDEGGRKVSSRIGLRENVYKTNEIKAEMKNGVLKVVLPKMKEEERTDVVHVKVE